MFDIFGFVNSTLDKIFPPSSNPEQNFDNLMLRVVLKLLLWITLVVVFGVLIISWWLIGKLREHPKVGIPVAGAAMVIVVAWSAFGGSGSIISLHNGYLVASEANRPADVQLPATRQSTPVTAVNEVDQPAHSPTQTLALPSITPQEILTLVVQQAETPSPVPLPQTATIAWDISHGPRLSTDGGLYDPSGIYSQLGILLTQNNINVVLYNQDLSFLDPTVHQAVVIAELSAWRRNYSDAEVTALHRYVEQGGGLLILSEKTGFANRVAPIAALFGVETGLHPQIDEVTSLQAHPITEGVERVEFLFGGGALRSENAAGTVAIQNDSPAVIALDGLPGRVVIIGDTNLFDNRGLSHADNERFAINVFGWLVIGGSW